MDYMLNLVEPGRSYDIQVQSIDRFGVESSVVAVRPLSVTRPKRQPFREFKHFVRERNTQTAELYWGNLDVSPLDPSLIK